MIPEILSQVNLRCYGGYKGGAGVSRYAQLAEYLKRQGAESLTLSFSEIEGLLGSPLPASARKLRVWWSNDATHAQARYGWLQAGWRVEAVDLDAGAVTFRRAGEPPTPLRARGVGGDVWARMRVVRRFEALAAEALSRLFGVRLYREVRMKVRLKGGVELTQVFDLASADGSVVGEVMYFAAGGAPWARFPAIAGRLWILEKVEAKAKFIAFGGDARVPRLWFERYGRLAGDVGLYYVGEDGRVEALAGGGALGEGLLREP
ncbi:MAG: hypothetical protein QXO20_04670 [Candidatus Bathyarchaeia archaeon]